MNSVHQFKIEGIEDNEIDFAAFRGKKIIVVNVASQCGYTSQYQQLQALYEEYSDRLVIVGVPSNDFGGQEPGSNGEIRAFCSANYGVSFPLAAKISIKGPSPHPLYEWLTRQTQNGVMDSEVRWNFQKYLLDEQGRLVKALPSSVEPFDEQVLEWIGA